MSHIGLAERVAIEAGLYRRDSLEKIAKDIGVKRRAVSEEIRRNRTLSPAAKYNGKSCRFASECKKQFVCRNYICSLSCVMCRKVDCTTVCPAFAPVTCSYTNKPPYVCNVCSRRRGCTADRAYYIATQAHAMAIRRFSDAHRKPQTQGDKLKTLDMLVSPLVKKGQPLTHIYAEHKDEIPVSERTLYRYIDAGLLGVGNLDLRRKVGYRPRRKKKVITESPKNNHEYRKSRTYEDFLAYLKKHPNVNYIEMDTVLGSRRKGKRMLTMLFVQQSLMLIFLMRDGKADSVVEHFDWSTSALGLKTFRKLFPVILTDNGSEFKHTIEMEQTIDGAHRTRIFYCDPQASWQKPHIEKNHEYIRYVIPKGKSMESYTQEDFTLLANHINSTKRLQYGGKAPIELATSDEFRELFYVMGIHKVEADDVTLTKRLFRT